MDYKIITPKELEELYFKKYSHVAVFSKVPQNAQDLISKLKAGNLSENELREIQEFYVGGMEIHTVDKGLEEILILGRKVKIDNIRNPCGISIILNYCADMETHSYDSFGSSTYNLFSKNPVTHNEYGRTPTTYNQHADNPLTFNRGAKCPLTNNNDASFPSTYNEETDFPTTKNRHALMPYTDNEGSLCPRTENDFSFSDCVRKLY